MIFVTVGTHEQPFNRLIRAVDDMKKNGDIRDDVFIQTGFSTYEPKYCKWNKWIPYDIMIEKVKEARIIISHGGPASFIMSLKIGKIPIVVPRQFTFTEHVNDHQVEFSRAVAERQGSIIIVEEMDLLSDVIENYDLIVSEMKVNQSSNNSSFNDEFEKIVRELMRKGRKNG